MRGLSFEAPMRPLDVQRDMYLDYTNTKAIKFYNKKCEKLPGEAFSGKMRREKGTPSTGRTLMNLSKMECAFSRPS